MSVLCAAVACDSLQMVSAFLLPHLFARDASFVNAGLQRILLVVRLVANFKRETKVVQGFGEYFKEFEETFRGNSRRTNRNDRESVADPTVDPTARDINCEIG